MPIAAAVSGGLGLAGSVGSSLISANAANKASSQQAQSQQNVLSMLQSVLGPIIGQGKGIVDSTSGVLTSLLTPGANQTQTLSQIPGFQFAQDWGQKAVQNIGTTTGLGGNTLTAGANFATGLAQQGYGNIVNSLQSLLNSGLSTETGAAQALGSGSATALTGIGNAQAAGTLGSANALSTGLTSGASSLGNTALLSALFNKIGGSGNVGANGGIYGGIQPPGFNPIAGVAGGGG